MFRDIERKPEVRSFEDLTIEILGSKTSMHHLFELTMVEHRILLEHLIMLKESNPMCRRGMRCIDNKCKAHYPEHGLFVYDRVISSHDINTMSSEEMSCLICKLYIDTQINKHVAMKQEVSQELQIDPVALVEAAKSRINIPEGFSIFYHKQSNRIAISETGNEFIIYAKNGKHVFNYQVGRMPCNFSKKGACNDIACVYKHDPLPIMCNKHNCPTLKCINKHYTKINLVVVGDAIDTNGYQIKLLGRPRKVLIVESDVLPTSSNEIDLIKFD